ncbi:MAG TPA: branched-chain amino acid ABC transporter permease [Planctomycetota bacterium]|nr:branched-chain amino acid ABC transporter permease [Planctomycetota bacterium]
MAEFLAQSLNGLTLGALYALVAIGYTMVFGIIKLINFAHGEFYMAGGFSGMLALVMLTGKGQPLEGIPGEAKLVLALALAAFAVGALAVITERLAYRPIRSGGRIAALLTAVGVSMLLQNAGIAVFGARNIGFPETVGDDRYPRTAVKLSELRAGEISDRKIEYWRTESAWMKQTLVNAGEPIQEKRLQDAIKTQPEHVYAVPAVTLHIKQIIIFVTLGISTFLLYLLVQKTRIGRAMRAVSHDMQAASLMGINTNRIVAITFSVGGGLAGVAGVLAGGMFISTVDPSMGFLFGLKAFIAAVLGGIGNIPGAVLGGLALGLIEQYSQHYADTLLFSGAGAYRDAIAFMLLIMVLLIRPRGFFGRIEGEKV